MNRRRDRASLARLVDGQNWREVGWAVIDVETTGLDFDSDDVVSIGMAQVRGGAVQVGESYYSLVRPAAALTGRSSTIHGLTANSLGDAPLPRDVALDLAARLQGSLVVAHAAWIEKGFLGRLSWITGQDLPLPVVDTAALSRALGVDDAPSGYEPQLELLARRLNVPVYTPHHALGDAMTAAVVFLALVSRLESVGGISPTAQDLQGLSRQYRA